MKLHNFLALSLPTIVALLPAMAAPDVQKIILAKGVGYQQGGAGAPVTVGQPYLFIARLSGSSGAVSSANLLLPGNSSQPLSSSSDGIQLQEAYLSQNGLNADFPDGNYTFTINAVHDGTRTVPLTLTGGSYPNTPQVANFADAQGVNPGADFTVTWNAFTGGTATDYVSFELDDANDNTVLQSPELGTAGALNGTSPAGFTIPAGTLTPNTTYTCKLLFAHVVQVNSTSYGQGVTAYAAYFKQTQFSLISTSQPDVSRISLLKGVNYLQSGAGSPVPTGQPYVFRGRVYGQSGTVNSASLKFPGGGTQALTSVGASLQLKASYLSRGGLDGDFPSGNYTFTINGAHDGTRNVPLTLTGDSYPNIPQVGNFAATQAVNASADFTVTWNAFTGGTATDYVQFVISDDAGNVVLQTPGLGLPGAWNGTSASAFTIPAGTLDANGSYSCVISFARFTQVNSTAYGQGVSAYAGYFSQTSFTLATVAPPDVKRLVVIKGVSYTQNRVATPVLTGSPDYPYVFQAFVDGAGGGLITGSLKLPNGTTKPFCTNCDNAGVQGFYLSPTAVDADYPPGNYTVTLNTPHNGTQTIVLPLPTAAFPNAPQVLNYVAALGVNPAADFTLQWNAFIGGTTNDFIQVEVDSADGNNTLYQSPQPGQTGRLNGTATSVTIPAGTLATGQTYQVQVTFAKILGQSTTYALDLSGYISQTHLPLVTTGTPVLPTLVASNPANGASNVSVNSAISFTFNEPMQPGHSINWSGNVNANQFTYSWSSDQRTLTCTYNTSLPAASEVDWVLNPAQSDAGFRDLAGNALATDIGGKFFTGGVAVPPTLNINQNGQFWHLHANGAIGQNYLIQNASSLTPPINWQPMVNFQGSVNGFDFNDGVVRAGNFYRVIPAN